MKYALLIHLKPGDTDGLSEDEQRSISAEYFAISEDTAVYGGAQLQPVEMTTTVRVNGNGEAITTDGPFAETKEIFGGFYLVEAGDIDKALEIAARIPAARMGGAIEVRPLVERYD